MRRLAAFALCLFPAMAAAQSQPPLTPDASAAASRAALAALGIAVVPSFALSSLTFTSAAREDTNFLSTQFTGGVDLGPDDAYYVEAALAVQSYNPTYLLPDGGGSTVDVDWSSLAVTLGAGPNIDLGYNFTFRPMVYGTLGYVFSDAIFGTLPLPVPGASGDLDDSLDGGLWAVGAGGSLGLLWRRDFGLADVYLDFRHSAFQLYAVNGSLNTDATANAIRSSVYAEYRRRIPGMQLFSQPLSWFVGAGAAHYFGDQAEILGTDTLSQIGGGLELGLPFEATLAPKGGRLAMSYVFGDGYEGISLGMSVRF